MTARRSRTKRAQPRDGLIGHRIAVTAELLNCGVQVAGRVQHHGLSTSPSAPARKRPPSSDRWQLQARRPPWDEAAVVSPAALAHASAYPRSAGGRSSASWSSSRFASTSMRQISECLEFDETASSQARKDNNCPVSPDLARRHPAEVASQVRWKSETGVGSQQS